MKLTPAVEADVQLRLARIEGQVRGVRRMLEEGRGCSDVVRQICAMRAALGKVAAAVVAENLEECVRRGVADGDEEPVAAAKRALLELI